MKFRVSQTSYWEDTGKIVKINTLDELINFMKECGYSLILSPKDIEDDKSYDYKIEIYDDWRE